MQKKRAKLDQALAKSSQRAHYRLYKRGKQWVNQMLVVGVTLVGFGAVPLQGVAAAAQGQSDPAATVGTSAEVAPATEATAPTDTDNDGQRVQPLTGQQPAAIVAKAPATDVTETPATPAAAVPAATSVARSTESAVAPAVIQVPVKAAPAVEIKTPQDFVAAAAQFADPQVIAQYTADYGVAATVAWMKQWMDTYDYVSLAGIVTSDAVPINGSMAVISGGAQVTTKGETAAGNKITDGFINGEQINNGDTHAFDTDAGVLVNAVAADPWTFKQAYENISSTLGKISAGDAFFANQTNTNIGRDQLVQLAQDPAASGVRMIPSADGQSAIFVVRMNGEKIPAQMQINGLGNDIVIYNVESAPGQTVTLDGGKSSEDSKHAIVWNVQGATTVKLGTQVSGKILAADAGVQAPDKISDGVIGIGISGGHITPPVLADTMAKVTVVDDDAPDAAGHPTALGALTLTGKEKDTKTYDASKLFDGDKYILSEGSAPLTGTTTLTTDDQDNVVIHVRHKIVDVTDPAQLTDNVTRTITYVVDGPAKAPATQTETTNFTRTGKTDLVTGESTFTDWTPASHKFGAVDSPEVVGYTPDRKQVAETTVKAGDQDLNETVTYHANEAKVVIDYLDTVTGEILETQTIKSHTDAKLADPTAEKTADWVAKHYTYLGDDVPDQFTVSAKGNHYTVKFGHKIADVTDPAELTDTVTRTITYVVDGPAKAPAAKTETATFSRAGQTDLVTGESTFTDWTPASHIFGAVDSPDVVGYTPDKKQVAETMVKAGDKDLKETVTYHANEAKVVIDYLDTVTGEILETQTIKSHTDAKLADPTAKKTADWVAKHYTYLGDDVPDQIVVSADGNHYTVKFGHKIVDVTDPAQLTDTVTRTITYVVDGPAKAPAAKTETATFNRTGQTDLVTGESTFTDWTPASHTFGVVDSPVVVGYTPDKKQVAETTVKAGDKDLKETVTYHANEAKVVIDYIDTVTGETLETQTIKSHTDAKLADPTAEKTADWIAKHYTYLSDDVPNQIVVSADVNHYTVKFGHKIVDVTDPAQLTDTVTRTITYVVDGSAKAPAAKTETTQFTRTGQTDLVTGESTFTDWTPASHTFGTVDSPEVVGYIPDKKQVAETTVKAGDKDLKETVTYHANEAKVVIDYIDTVTGETLETQTIKSHTDAKLADPTAEKTAGWVAKHYTYLGDDVPDQIVVSADGNHYIVKFGHKIVDVTDPAQLTDTVTRTITYVVDGSAKAPAAKTETTQFTRTGKTDLVTGESTFTDWTPASHTFGVVDSPDVVGYTPDKKQVAETTVKAGDKDLKETVTYHANEATITIIYHDVTTGTDLTSQKLIGHVDQDVADPTAVTIKALEQKGFELVDSNVPTTIHFGAKGMTFVVNFKHGTKTITPDQPGTPGQPVDPDNPDGPKWPDQSAKDDLIREITETIHYVYADGSTAAQDVTDIIRFTRTGVVDLVTGVVTYGDWHAVANDTTFAAKNSPIIAGFTADPERIQQLTGITPDTHAKAFTVVYTATPKPIAPKPVTPTAPTQHLPQTGDDVNSALTLLGLLAASTSALFLYYGKRKHEH
ncbi:mucin-binding protein [Lacticaseibacillus daqingensis]|uniref:mucin-binding protein n=1 Tax=Lacticaseibacillus daqingensis TaxID=2486014 RepID=UPI0013DDCF82|nr:LPXTG cell wall anchor domain-containing protein [Lacticaseibacillus daqingensis]